MSTNIEVVSVESMPIAAVRGRATLETLPAVIGELLDRVWSVVRSRELVTNHNVVVYLQPPSPGGSFDIDVGVQVAEAFDGESDDGVRCAAIPAARVVRATHVGPYNRISETHELIIQHCEGHSLEPTGVSWEIYGDWDDDPSKLETEVAHAVEPEVRDGGAANAGRPRDDP